MELSVHFKGSHFVFVVVTQIKALTFIIQSIQNRPKIFVFNIFVRFGVWVGGGVKFDPFLYSRFVFDGVCKNWTLNLSHIAA